MPDHPGNTLFCKQCTAISTTAYNGDLVDVFDLSYRMHQVLLGPPHAYMQSVGKWAAHQPNGALPSTS
jgi:hypothetical protein